MQNQTDMRTGVERLLAILSAYNHHRARSGAVHDFLRRVAWLRFRLWSIITGTDIQPGASIGRGLRLPHPNGVVIHRCAIVGDDCLIMQQVTLGQLENDLEAPRLGNNVYVGSGAKILGAVMIGDHARIGANAVVMRDVPAHCTAVGIPARVICPKEGIPIERPTRLAEERLELSGVPLRKNRGPR